MIHTFFYRSWHVNLHLVSQNRRPGKTRDGRAAYRSMLTGLTRLRTAEPCISLCPHFSGGVVLLLANGLTLPVRTGPPPGGLVDEMPTTAGQWRSLTKSMPDLRSEVASRWGPQSRQPCRRWPRRQRAGPPCGRRPGTSQPSRLVATRRH